LGRKTCKLLILEVDSLGPRKWKLAIKLPVITSEQYLAKRQLSRGVHSVAAEY